MADIPSSLTQCQEPKDLKLGEYLTKTTDLAKATGMDQTCVKQTETDLLDMGASGSASVGWGAAEAGFQTHMTKLNNKMNEIGCGQFAMNINSQLNAMKDINCTIRNNSSSVSTIQKGENSIVLKTLPRTPEENANLAELQKDLKELKQQAMMLMSNPNIPKENLEILLKLNQSNTEDIKALINSYSRDINISNSKIEQQIIQKQSGSISIETAQEDLIIKAQKVIAKTTAENKLAQELGLNAVSPNSKSIIENRVENSTLFSNTNVQNTINSIKLQQEGFNSLTLISSGSIKIDKSSISQSIVQDLVIKTLISNASKAGLQLSSEIVSEATSTIASNGKSAGVDALMKEIGDARAKAIQAAKVSSGMGGAMAMIIVVILVLGFGVLKTGSAIMNNSIFIMALVSIVFGIIFLTKAGVSNKVLGSVLILFGVAGIAFGGVMRMRLQAQGQ